MTSRSSSTTKTLGLLDKACIFESGPLTRAPLKIEEKFRLICAELCRRSSVDVVRDNPGLKTTIKSEHGSALLTDWLGEQATVVLLLTVLALSALAFACSGKFLLGFNFTFFDGRAFEAAPAELPPAELPPAELLLIGAGALLGNGFLLDEELFVGGLDCEEFPGVGFFPGAFA